MRRLGAVWTTYAYDSLGRTVTVTEPDGSHIYYAYSFNTVTVTDAANNSKTYTSDAFGNVRMVAETDPALGAVSTSYTYDVLDHLTQVSMPRGSVTQTRTFNYIDPVLQRPGALLRSATNPENGTVTYGYNGNNLLTSKTDAKGQTFSYSYDTYNRPVSVSLGGQALRTYYYDSNPLDSAHTFSANALGRLAAIGYAAGAAGQVAEWFSYTQAGAVAVKRLQFTQAYSPGVNYVPVSVTANLDASYAYDGEGGLTSVAYPGGPTYAYAYDTLHRLSTLTDQSNHLQRVNGVSYNADGQWAGLTYFGDAETRTYNNLGQLTRIRIPNIFQEDYRFPAGTDNGKVSSIATYPSGEEVTYQYDSLNRLIAATTTAASDAAGVRPWGESFGYDGFGNLTRKTVTKGTAAALSIAVDGNTNRVSGASYDANGNALMAGTQQLAYDVENRLATVSQYGSQQVGYVYDGSNRRIWRGTYASNGTLTGQEAYFYGVDGRKLGTYFLGLTYQALTTTLIETRTYFGSKLVAVNGQAFVSDRLGSLRNNVSFYPYGDEKSNNAPNDAVKFATYTRDGVTALDYAVNRYYSSGLGRFMTPDPYVASGGTGDPGSWNRYAYTRGDSVNRMDPLGTCDQNSDTDFSVTVCGGNDSLGGVGGGGAGDSSGMQIVNSIEEGSGGGGGTIFTYGPTTTPLRVTNFSNTGPKQDAVTNVLKKIENALSANRDCSNWLQGGGVAGSDLIQALIDNNSYGYGDFNSNSVAAFAGSTNADGSSAGVPVLQLLPSTAMVRSSTQIFRWVFVATLEVR